jgi:hypothetical protein
MLGTEGRLCTNELSFVPRLMRGNLWALVVELFHIGAPQMLAELPARKELVMKHRVLVSAIDEERSHGAIYTHPGERN